MLGTKRNIVVMYDYYEKESNLYQLDSMACEVSCSQEHRPGHDQIAACTHYLYWQVYIPTYPCEEK